MKGLLMAEKEGPSRGPELASVSDSGPPGI